MVFEFYSIAIIEAIRLSQEYNRNFEAVPVTGGYTIQGK